MTKKVGIEIEVEVSGAVKKVKDLGDKTSGATVDFTKLNKSISQSAKVMSTFEKSVSSVVADINKLKVSTESAVKPADKLEKEFDQINKELKESKKRIGELGDEFKKLSNDSVKSKEKIGKLNKEIEKLKSSTNKVSKSTKKARKGLVSFEDKINLTTISIAALAFGTVKLATDLVQLSDKYSLLRSQLKLVVDDIGQLDNVQNKLLETANETRQSFEATVKLYARLDRATEQLLLTDKEVIAATNTLNKAIIVSGASAQESEAAIIQLSQGLASGALRGDELRSVLEQVPRVARLIADGLGVSVGALRELGTQGKLTTAAIINAIKSQTDIVNQEFGKIEETSGQVWTTLKNNASAYVVEMESVNKAQGLFKSILETIRDDLGDSVARQSLANAKNTSIFTRTLEQQQAIVDNLIEKNRQYFDDYSKRGREQASILAIALTNQRDNLKFVEERIKKEEAEASVIKEKQILEKKALDIAFLARKEQAFNEDLAERSFINILSRNKAIDDYNESLNETLRVNNQISSAQADQQSIDQSTLVNDVQKQIDLGKADSFEKEKILLQERAEAQALAASEIFDTEEELNNALLKIDENYTQKSMALDEERAKANQKNALDTVALTNSALKEIFGENKAFASADIIINTARGVQRSFADLPPPWNGIQAGIIGASGVAQLAKVNGAKFADGTEFVNGGGTNRSDSVPAMLSRGERVVDAQTNAQLGGVSNDDLLSAVNGNSGGVTFNISAGVGTDLDSLAQAVTNGFQQAKNLGYIRGAESIELEASV